MNHLESNLIKESGYSADVESSSSVSSDSESSDSACHTSKGIDCEHLYEFFLWGEKCVCINFQTFVQLPFFRQNFGISLADANAFDECLTQVTSISLLQPFDFPTLTLNGYFFKSFWFVFPLKVKLHLFSCWSVKIYAMPMQTE